jgi:hypothetical protein
MRPPRFAVYGVPVSTAARISHFVLDFCRSMIPATVFCSKFVLFVRSHRARPDAHVEAAASKVE